MTKIKSNPKIKTLDNYILLTHNNKEFMKMHEHFYVLSPVGNQFELLGIGDIRPRLTKGVMEFVNMPAGQKVISGSIYIHEPESVDEYYQRVVSPLDILIDMKKAYVKKADKVVTRYVFNR